MEFRILFFKAPEKGKGGILTIAKHIGHTDKDGELNSILESLQIID